MRKLYSRFELGCSAVVSSFYIFPSPLKIDSKSAQIQILLQPSHLIQEEGCDATSVIVVVAAAAAVIVTSAKVFITVCLSAGLHKNF